MKYFFYCVIIVLLSFPLISDKKFNFPGKKVLSSFLGNESSSNSKWNWSALKSGLSASESKVKTMEEEFDEQEGSEEEQENEELEEEA